MKKVDEYVDSLAPQIQPRIASELEIFQQKTIDSLETQVIEAFRSLFKNNENTSRDLGEAAPDAYGGQSLPFAEELVKLTRGLSKTTDGVSDDLRDIFKIIDSDRSSDGSNDTRSRGTSDGASLSRGFLSAAINAVQDHLDNNTSGRHGKFEVEGLLGVLGNAIKDAASNPEEKARVISPEIREKVGAKLREQHAPIAENFTRIALDHIKRWLRGNTTSRDLGDGVKGEIEGQVKDLVKGLGGLFGHKKGSDGGSNEGFRAMNRDGDAGNEESKGGFSKIISDKLSNGLARVHRDVRLEFRKVLGLIEKQLFEILPDVFQRPIEKILGGNPFDSQLQSGDGQRSWQTGDRDFGDDVMAKLADRIRGFVRKVQETLRVSILGVVNGGHRKFEQESWMFVQSMVEQKVQKYLPKVKISVPDDIGNEGVSVGDPNSKVGLIGASQQAENPLQAQSSASYQNQQHNDSYQNQQSNYPNQNQQHNYPNQNQQHSYENQNQQHNYPYQNQQPNYPNQNQQYNDPYQNQQHNYSYQNQQSNYPYQNQQ